MGRFRRISQTDLFAGLALLPPAPGTRAKIVTVAASMGTDDAGTTYDNTSTGPTWRTMGGAPPTDSRLWFYKFSDTLATMGMLLSSKISIRYEWFSRSIAAFTVTVSAIRTAFTPVHGAAVGALTLETLGDLDFVYDGSAAASTNAMASSFEAFLNSDAALVSGPYYGLRLAISSGATDGTVNAWFTAPTIGYAIGT